MGCEMRSEAAETLGLQALGWLAADDELFGTFLGASGAQASDMAAAAQSPEFLGAVLDFLIMEDAWVIAFCDAHGHPYTAPMMARAVLPGGAATHWT